MASSHSEARTLVLQYVHECISTDSSDAARFQKLIPLCKAAAVEAAAAAAHLTPDTSDEALVCLHLSEETRRLAAVGSYRSLERLLDRHHKVGSGAGGMGGGGGVSCYLNRVSVAQRENAATMAPTEHKCCHRGSHSGSICVWSTQHLFVEHAAFLCGARSIYICVWSTQHLCAEHAAFVCGARSICVEHAAFVWHLPRCSVAATVAAYVLGAICARCHLCSVAAMVAAFSR